MKTKFRYTIDWCDSRKMTEDDDIDNGRTTERCVSLESAEKRAHEVMEWDALGCVAVNQWELETDPPQGCPPLWDIVEIAHLVRCDGVIEWEDERLSEHNDQAQIRRE